MATNPNNSTSKALLIGINYFNIPEYTLRGCIHDVNNVYNMLVQSYQYLPSNITILRDDSPANMPTLDMIMKSLTEIVSASESCQEIWIHYSGHGAKLTIDKNREPVDIIIPADCQTAGYINGDMIYDIIKNIKSKAILIFDSCKSEMICELEWTFENNNGIVTKIHSNPQHTIENPNIVMFSGSKDDQLSMDKYDVLAKEVVGVMTDALLHCLEKNQYMCSIDKLYLDICEYVRREGYIQKPCMSSSSTLPIYVFTIPEQRSILRIPPSISIQRSRPKPRMKMVM